MTFLLTVLSALAVALLFCYLLFSFLEGRFLEIPFASEIVDWVKDVFSQTKNKIEEVRYPQIKVAHLLREVHQNYSYICKRNNLYSIKHTGYTELSGQITGIVAKSFLEYKRTDIRNILLENEKMFHYILFTLKENEKIMKKNNFEAFNKIADLLKLFVQEFDDVIGSADRKASEREELSHLKKEQEEAHLLAKKEKQIHNELDMILDIKKREKELKQLNSNYNEKSSKKRNLYSSIQNTK